jgi:SAM-dependent methyltransferase
MTVMDQTLDQALLEEFLGRVVGDLSAAYGAAMASLGGKLGLYEAMAGGGPLTSDEVARRAGCDERLVREWLNAQAAGGYVEYHPQSRSYELTAEQAAVLADPASPVYVTPAWDIPASMFIDEEQTIEAFRTGGGVSWGERHPRLHHGIAGFYRNAYHATVATEWIPALDGVAEVLAAGGRVADVGCGHGHSTVAMAQAFPAARLHGFDVHEESVEAARANARAAGVADRTTFEVADAGGFPGAGYDLICFFDALHDFGDPVGALRRSAEALAPGGTVMLVEPYAGDRVEDNLNPVGRLFYAASTVICTAHGISEGGSDVLGAQAGQARIAEVCRRAGLPRVRRAAETPFNLVLEARAA